jgi:TonB family protein
MNRALLEFALMTAASSAADAWTTQCVGGAEAQSERAYRIGGNVGQQMLLLQVDPILPAEAVAARVFRGVVVLEIRVNKKGEVGDVRVLRGHPLLDQAAIDAVRQWKYAPTLRAGEPVATIRGVSIDFGVYPQPGVLTLDDSGTLRDSMSDLEGDALVDRLKTSSDPIQVVAGLSVPLAVVHRELRRLREQGLSFSIKGAFCIHDGRLFYEDRSGVPRNPLFEPPQVQVDTRRVAEMVRAAGRAHEFPTGKGGPTLRYRLYIDEIGHILSVENVGPKIPEIEPVLARTRVIAPARRGSDRVPAALIVGISVED